MSKDYQWLRGVIISCTNEFQLDCARTLINLYVTKHWFDAGMADDFFSLADTWKQQFDKLPK